MKTICHQQTYTKRNTKSCCSVRREKTQEAKLKDKISNKKSKYMH